MRIRILKLTAMPLFEIGYFYGIILFLFEENKKHYFS